MSINELEISIEQVVTSGGYSISANGVLTVTLKSSYSCIKETMSLLQMLNNDIELKAKVPGEKDKALGKYFRIKQITIDGDGEQSIRLQGLTEFSDVNEISLLPFKNSEVPEFKVFYSSLVEVETDTDEWDDEDNEDDDDEWDDEDDWE